MNPFPKNTAKLDEQAQQQQQLLQYLKSNPELLKKYQEEMTKMQGAAKTNRAFQQPMTPNEYNQKVSNKTIQQFLDQEGGLLIQPQAGIVLKFVDRHTGQKIFVNVVKHPGVDHPEQKILVDLENQSGLRIPMSMGRVREDRDKKGVPCKVVDVVMNDRIVDTADKNAEIFYFMAQIISNYLLEKYKIAVAEDKVVKVNMKYKGTNVDIQRIRAKKNPKIQQVAKQQEQKSKEQFEEQERLLNELSGNTGKTQKRPEITIYGLDFQNNREEYSLQSKGQVKQLEIEYDLSLLIHSRGIHLQGSDKIIYLFVRGLYEICLRLPESIKSYRAIFGRKQRKLKVFCQVQGKEQESDNKQRVENKKIDIKIETQLLDQLV